MMIVPPSTIPDQTRIGHIHLKVAGLREILICSG